MSKLLVLNWLAMVQYMSLREVELALELQEMSPVCYICGLSEERRRCEVLTDSSKCKKNICMVCFKKHRLDACLICAQKVEEHYKKVKTAHRSSVFEEANKMYNREHKIRRQCNDEFESLDFDLINLMAYYNAHPQVAVRKKYDEVEKEIRRILQNKRKDQRTLLTETSKVKQANILQKHHDQLTSGLQSCGYNRRYDKGINLLRLAWGYDPLTSQEFDYAAELVHKEKSECSEEAVGLSESGFRLGRVGDKVEVSNQ